MPPVKDEKPPKTPLNTTAQIQQIFSEVQLQLPTVNFDDDDQNDDNEEVNHYFLVSIKLSKCISSY
jgi:hypothetical protein